MNDAPPKRLDPGSTIGILGDGQLGRMIAIAAARLGYRCHTFADQPDSPAAQVCAASTLADYRDTKALDAFAAAVDVVTLEFENVPDSTAHYLTEQLEGTAVSVSRLAQGVPVGGELDYLDEGTLAAAIKARRRV